MFEIKTLSPIHVGSGEEISPMEYVVEGEDFFRVDMEGVFHDKERFEREKFLEFIDDTTLKKKAAYFGTFDREIAKAHPRYILKMIEGIDEKYPSQVKEFIKTSDKFYIPGSSIKGAILSALYWYELKEGSNSDGGIEKIVRACLTKDFRSLQELQRNERYKRFIVTRWNRKYRRNEIDFGGTLQNIVFECLIGEKEERIRYVKRRRDRKGIERITNDIKFAPWLQVTDTNPISEAGAYLGLCKVYGSSRDIGIFYELLKPGVSLYFDMAAQKTGLELVKMLEITDSFYSLVLEANKKWLSGNAIPINLDGIESQRYKLRLGQGSSSLATSMLILADELGIKEEYLRKWRVTKYHTEPKTRKLVFEDGKPTYPLGWVKLELKNE